MALPLPLIPRQGGWNLSEDRIGSADLGSSFAARPVECRCTLFKWQQSLKRSTLRCLVRVWYEFILGTSTGWNCCRFSFRSCLVYRPVCAFGTYSCWP